MPRRLAMVRAVAARLGAASTTSDVANATLEAATEFLESVTASVWLITEDRSSLEVRYEANAHPDAIARFARIPLTATDLPGSHVIATGTACFLESTEQREQGMAGAGRIAVAQRSHGCPAAPGQRGPTRRRVVRLLARARVVRQRGPRRLLAIADQCAIALDRARLYEEERERAEGQSLLATISGAVSPQMDWVALARHAASMCVGEFVDACAVYVREGAPRAAGSPRQPRLSPVGRAAGGPLPDGAQFGVPQRSSDPLRARTGRCPCATAQRLGIVTRAGIRRYHA